MRAERWLVSFGDDLRMLRVAAGLSQEELAARAGLTANGVSVLERGVRTRPYPHTLRVLADALRLSGTEREQFMASGRDRAIGAQAAEAPGRRDALPVPLTELIGREEELRNILDLLGRASQRLVTLTGPGGVGKTRLAVEAARSASPVFSAGVSFLDLAGISDPALAPSVITASADSGGTRGAAENRDGRALLVLDNFEHLMAAAPAVAELLAHKPFLTVLATSRARLRIRGEVEVPVRPLALPTTPRDPALPDVSASAAGRLFIERARAVQPVFTLTSDNAADVAAVCWRLGGLPLALELAAAKVRWLHPRELLARLDQALSIGWSRDLPERQQTLRATLDWSYRLLQEGEKALLQRLSVFAGGFTLTTAEELLGPDLGIEQILPSLESLVEHSLVALSDDGTYFRLLEPIREYAGALLRDGGAEESMRARHATYFLTLAERAVPEYRRHDQIRWLERTDWESNNLRAAMQWALSTGAGETAARLGWALWQPWWIRGQFDEGRRAMEGALRLDLSPELRTRVLVVHASLCDAQGDLARALQSWTSALRIARLNGDLAGQAYGLAGTGLVAMSSDPDRATRLLFDAVSLADQVGEEWLLSLGTIWLGTMLLVAGDHKAAAERFEAALAAAKGRGDRLVTSVALINLGRALLLQQRLGDAAEVLCESVLLSAAMRDRANITFALDLLAVVAGRRGNWYRCAVLFGAAGGMRASMPALRDYYLPDIELYAAAAHEAEQSLGAAEYAAATEEGQALSLDAIATYVCSEAH